MQALAWGFLAGGGFSLRLLDEPTSAIDQATEARLLERLAATRPKVSVIASIYRMSSLQHFDQVAPMFHERVIDFGTFDRLQQRQATIRNLVGITA